jgi:hypothetical protein
MSETQISSFISPWKVTQPKKTKEEPQKVKRQKDIRYPIFYDASECIEDEFWKNIFIDISRGRFPKKISIDNNTVFAGTKRNQLTYCYSNKTCQQLATELRPLLMGHLSIYSVNDIKQTSEATDDYFNDFVNRASENCWKKIKNKKMKHSLIVDYVLRKKEEWNLNWNQSREFLEILDNSIFTYHTHVSSDIIMENGTISNIEDIVYRNGEIINLRSQEINVDSDPEEPKEKLQTINDSWITYIKTLSSDL